MGSRSYRSCILILTLSYKSRSLFKFVFFQKKIECEENISLNRREIITKLRIQDDFGHIVRSGPYATTMTVSRSNQIRSLKRLRREDFFGKICTSPYQVTAINLELLTLENRDHSFKTSAFCRGEGSKICQICR